MKATSNKLYANKYRANSNRLKGYDYALPGWYFITICTFKQKYLLGNVKDGKSILNEYGVIAEQELLRSAKIRKEIEIDEYVLMPNHIHILIGIDFENYVKTETAATHQVQRKKKSISSFISAFKGSVTKRTSIDKVWQPGYYDHIVRSEKYLNKIRAYIANNPLLWTRDRYNQRKY